MPDSVASARAALVRGTTAAGFRVELDETGRGGIRRGAEWRAVVFGSFARFVRLDVSILGGSGSTVIQLAPQSYGWINVTSSIRHDRVVQRLVEILTVELGTPCLQLNAA